MKKTNFPRPESKRDGNIQRAPIERAPGPSMELTQRKGREACVNRAHDQLEHEVRERTRALEAAIERLRFRENEVRTLVENSQDLIFRFDLKGRHIYANLAAAKLYGKNLDGLRGRRMRDLGTGRETWESARAIFDRVVASGAEAGGQIAHGVGERRRYYDTRFVPEFGAGGVLASILVVARDVTERVRTEEQVLANERLLWAVFNSSFQYMGLLSAEGHVIMINDTALRFAGLKMEDVRGMPFWMTPWWTLSPETQDKVQRAVERAARGETVRYEEVVQGAENQLKTIDFFLRPLDSPAGISPLLIAEAHDITELKRMTDALRDAETLARVQAETVLEGILTHDCGIIQEANNVVENMFGWSPAELLGKSLIDLIEPESRTLVRQSLVTSAGQRYECLALTRDGQRFPIAIQSRRFPYQGRHVGMVVIHDLTDQQRDRARIRKLEQEEALKREKAERESFARRLIETQERERCRIATDLHDGLGQNILAIKHHAERCLANGVSPGRTAESLQEITSLAAQAVREIRAIVQDLHPYLVERLGLTRALQAMVESIAKLSSVHIVSEIQNIDGVLKPEAEIGLYRILQECLTNVVRHSQATEARLCVAPQQRWVCASVEDTGQGFDLTRIRHGDSASSGLGLRGIVERSALLGGSAWIASHPGGGTRVELQLPIGTAREDSSRGAPLRLVSEPGSGTMSS